MEQNAKYLRVTIHDNDYRTSLEYVCDALYEIFWFAGYPTEQDFPNLKKCIKHLWFGTHATISLLDKGTHTNDIIHTDDIKYFEPYLEFVDYVDIPDWDNAESAYIPMFDDAEVLHR